MREGLPPDTDISLIFFGPMYEPARQILRQHGLNRIKDFLMLSRILGPSDTQEAIKTEFENGAIDRSVIGNLLYKIRAFNLPPKSNMFNDTGNEKEEMDWSDWTKVPDRLQIFKDGHICIGFHVENWYQENQRDVILGPPVYLRVEDMAMGLAVTGVKGSGKSVFLMNLGIALAEAGITPVYLDVMSEYGNINYPQHSDLHLNRFGLPRISWLETPEVFHHVPFWEVGMDITEVPGDMYIDIFKSMFAHWTDASSTILITIINSLIQRRDEAHDKKAVQEQITFKDIVQEIEDRRDDLFKDDNQYNMLMNNLANSPSIDIFDKPFVVRPEYLGYVEVPPELYPYGKLSKGQTKYVAKILVIDINNMTVPKKQITLLTLMEYIKRIREKQLINRDRNLMPPVVFLIDEYPRYVPQYDSPVTRTIRNILSEGRKSGIGGVFIVRSLSKTFWEALTELQGFVIMAGHKRTMSENKFLFDKGIPYEALDFMTGLPKSKRAGTAILMGDMCVGARLGENLQWEHYNEWMMVKIYPGVCAESSIALDGGFKSLDV